MNPVTETRLIRLQMLVKKHNGSLADLNEAIGLVRTDATLSQIRTKAPHSKTGKPRVMGDDLARKIEERLSLECGWMDTPPSYAEIHGEDDPLTEAIKIMQDMSAQDAYRALAVVKALKTIVGTQAAPAPGAAEEDTEPKATFSPSPAIPRLPTAKRGEKTATISIDIPRHKDSVFDMDQAKKERSLMAAMAGAKTHTTKTQRK